MRSVKEYEPSQALFAGVDGMSVIRPLVEQSVSYLNEGGVLLLETGIETTEATRMLLEGAGFHGVCVFSDLAGIPRVVQGQVANTKNLASQ